MHFGLITQHVGTGDGQGAINHAVAHAALERGHAITLLATSVEADLRNHPHVQWIRITPGIGPTQLVNDQVFAWRTARWLQAHRHRLDGVMANGAITWSAADVNAMHFVHGAWLRSGARVADGRSWLHTAYHNIYSRINAAWERRALRQARVAVAVSEMVSDQIRSLGEDVSVEVIPNGIDPSVFTPNGPHVDRAAMGVPHDAPLALFVGDLQIPLKNLDTVLKAVAHVPSVHLAVAGTIDDSPSPALAQRLGIATRVHFLGFRRDIPALMRTADLFVFPSRYETFSLVLLEAMASGTPVVTASTVGASDLVTPEAGVVMDDPNDTEALVHHLRRLVDAPNKRRAMGREARSVAEQYPLSRTAHRYVDLLERLSAETGAPAAIWR